MERSRNGPRTDSIDANPSRDQLAGKRKDKRQRGRFFRRIHTRIGIPMWAFTEVLRTMDAGMAKRGD